MLSLLNKYINIFLITILFVINLNNKINDIQNKEVQTDDIYLNLVIPSINLDENIYKYDSKYNNVNHGLELINDFQINNMKGSIIIASHSGSSKISYFKNLHKLSIEDKVILKNKENKYTYEITKIYKIKKNGKFKYKDLDNTIYLITCDKNNKKKQLVFQGNLIKSEKIRNFGQNTNFF